MSMSMTLSSSFSVASSHQFSQLCCSGLKWEQKRLVFLKPQKRKFQFLWIVKSILDNRKFSSISNNGAIEPDRILLERLFKRAQKLEQQIGRDPCSPQAIELGANLGMLESDLQAALSALKKKEKDLQAAETKVLLEKNEKNRVKKNLQAREKELIAARVKQEKLEQGLKLASMNLASQSTEIDDLNFRLKEKDQEISAVRSAFLVKENEIIKMKNELMKMSEKASDAELELSSKANLLNEANKIVENQEIEVQELYSVIQNKEKELELFRNVQKSEAEKFKVAELNLRKQTMDWLLAQQEMKKLVEETSKHVEETNGTFGRVGKLLSVVKSELVSSQKALALTKQKMDGQDQMLEKYILELDVQRKSVTSYMVSLRDAQLELDSERMKLRVAEAEKKNLERDLLVEEELVGELQKELDKETLLFEQAIQEQSALKQKLEKKSAEFEELRILLQVKESELVEARLEIQYLKSEHVSLQFILEGKDSELSHAKKKLEEVNQEISELKMILFSRDEEVNQLMSMINEKDEHVKKMENKVNDAKLKFSEAETVVEQIVDLTNKMVLSVNDDSGGFYVPSPHNQTNSPADSFKWKIKQLGIELENTRESLRAKEIEILAAQKAMSVKDEELKLVLGKLNTKENEITELNEEMVRNKDDLKQFYSLTQERFGEKSVGYLVIEKLQLEAAQREVEVATSALQKIMEMSRELMNKPGLSIGSDFVMINENECSGDVKTEVSRLLTLTERLVRDADITGRS